MKGQPTLWPIGEVEEKYSVPDDYPWFFHERLAYYKARLIHPSVAAVMAAEDVAHKEAMERRKLRRLQPTLFDEQKEAEKLRKDRPRLYAVA